MDHDLANLHFAEHNMEQSSDSISEHRDLSGECCVTRVVSRFSVSEGELPIFNPRQQKTLPVYTIERESPSGRTA